MARKRKRRRNKKRMFIAYFLRTICVFIIVLIFAGAFFLIKGLLGKVNVSNSNKEVTENTVEISKKGQITGDIYEDFDKDYYDEKELSAMIDSEIDDYNRLHGNPNAVVKKSFSVDEDKAMVKIEYDSADSYSGFNGKELYVCTVGELIDSGFVFNQNLMDVSDKTSFISATDIKNYNDYKAVVTDENIKIICPGKVLYRTSNISLIDKSSGRAEVSDDYAVLIYK